MEDFKSASQILLERQETARLSTGNADLDSLLGGGIEKGQFYLFYGGEDSGVDLLIHHIIVNSVLPETAFGFNGKCVYSNCGNYRQERTMLDTQLLCHLIKSAKIDTSEALDKIYTICSFSEEQQEQVFTEIQRLLSRDKEIKTVVVHNIAKLFTTNTGTPNKNAGQRIMRLQKTVFEVWQTCAQNRLALVASCRPAKSHDRFLPRPEGGKYLGHKATVIVQLQKKKKGYVSARLVKHPNRPLRSLYISLAEGGVNLGRIKTPFRTLLQEEMDNLKRTYKEALMDVGRRDAFDSLIKAWSSEQGAMSYARVPTALDVMLLTAVTDNRKKIEEIQDTLQVLESRLKKLATDIETL